MTDIIKELKNILVKLDSMNNSNEENTDLLSVGGSIDKYSEIINKKLVLGISRFENFNKDNTLKYRELNQENKQEYRQAYYEVLSSIASISDYIGNIHKILFWMNKKRLLMEGKITEEEYNQIIYTGELML